jgi:excisionase family DNA binding protein
MITAWMTRQEAADHLRVSVDTIDRYARDGRIKKYVIAGTRTTRYKVSELDALLAPEEETGCDHDQWEHDQDEWSCANCGCPLAKADPVSDHKLLCGHTVDLTLPLSEVEMVLSDHFCDEHLDKYLAAA